MQMDATLVYSAVGTAVVAVFGAGGVWANFLYMRKSMVTKKDLKIALGDFKDNLRTEFVTVKECELMMKSRTNGEARGASRERG